MTSQCSKSPGHPVWHSLARLTKILMANPALHTIDQVPDMFKEVYILSGYRSPRSSPWECIASVFERTNETFNFWTHFLPSLYFMWRTAFLWPHLSTQGTYAYPMMACLVSIATFPIMSAVAHIFNAMSDRARHICFFLDYAALGFYILCAAIAYRTYVFPTYMLNTWYSEIYLPMAALFSIIALVLSCQSRFLPVGVFKKTLRMTAFSVPYFFVSFPLMCRILLCEGEECSWSALLSLKCHFFLAFLSAFLFATHVPERLYPGRFDIVGHSHQLFHLFSAVASYYQMNTILEDMETRKELVMSFETVPDPGTTLKLISIVMLIHSLVLMYFIYKLKYFIPAVDKEDSCSCGEDQQKSLFLNNNAKVTSLRHRVGNQLSGDHS